MRKLDLEDCVAEPSEGGLADRQVELPSPTKAFAVLAFGFGARRFEAGTPGFEGLGVVQPEHFHIGHDKACSFGCRHDLGKGRDVSPWEDAPRNLRLGRPRTLGATDSVNDGDAVGLQEGRKLAEIGAEMGSPHVFKHSDRNDAVIDAV